MKTKNFIIKIKFVQKNVHVELSLSMREVISCMMSVYFMVTEKSVIPVESFSEILRLFS